MIIFLLIPKDIGLLKAIPFLCRYEWKPIAPKPTDRSAFAEATALHKWEGAFLIKYVSTLSNIRMMS